MSVDFILPLSITLAIIIWSLIMYWYIHPVLSRYPLEKAIEPFLWLHTFRYIGLMFLVPGVTSEMLDTRFSHPAAYGDLIAAILALLAIVTLRFNTNWALASVWIFNIWGMADLLNAVTRGLLYTADGHLGATYWIPATIVPLLLVTHVFMFILLITHIRKNKQVIV